MFLEEQFPDDGFLSDGELVSVLNADGSLVNNYVFSYPTFEFESDLVDSAFQGLFVFHSLVFTGFDTGLAYREEHYLDLDGVTECIIVLEEL
jgi:hypothetical protein